MTFHQRIATWRARHEMLSNFTSGVFVGWVLSTIYLLSGGEVFPYVPTWVELVFYPGFVIGLLSYDLVGFNGAIALRSLAHLAKKGTRLWTMPPILRKR
jgi:hypothetical protein